MTFSVSILATGSELLDGRVVDTNSNLVARALCDLGLKLKRVLVVDDDREELIDGLRELSTVSQLIITSGGLGPTEDDLTREIFSQFFGVGLAEFPAARAHLEDFYSKRSRRLDPANLKQALLPIGSSMIPNLNGTAPGFYMTAAPSSSICDNAQTVTVCSLSGVPREFGPMFSETVLPLIRSSAGKIETIQRKTFRLFGVPESVVGRIVEGCSLPKSITVSYRAAFPEVHLVLKAPSTIDLTGAAESIRAALNRGVIYSEEAQETFTESIQNTLLKHKASVATAESCTGGLISSYLTETPGSSQVFLGGVTSYANSVKESLLKVTPETLSSSGAVSAETVRAMAATVRDLIGATYGVAISGVAGPDGGSAEKPVGTFYIGISGPSRSFEVRALYINDRRSIRVYAAYVALDLLRREVLGLEIPESYPIFG